MVRVTSQDTSETLPKEAARVPTALYYRGSYWKRERYASTKQSQEFSLSWGDLESGKTKLKYTAGTPSLLSGEGQLFQWCHRSCSSKALPDTFRACGSSDSGLSGDALDLA